MIESIHKIEDVLILRESSDEGLGIVVTRSRWNGIWLHFSDRKIPSTLNL